MIKKLYGKYKEIIDYLFWGAMAFFLYMVLYWVFTSRLGWREILATLIDNFICIIFAFFTNKLFVFRSKAGSVKGFFREFVSFFVARIFTLVLSELMTWIGCDLLGYNTESYRLIKIVNDGLIVQLITQVVVIVSNYILSKLWIFKKDKKSEQEKA